MPEAYVSYVFCLLSICKRTPLLDTEGFYLLAWLTPHQQRLVRAVAFRFARRRPVLPCVMSLHNSIHTKIQHDTIYIFISAYF